MAQRGTRGTQPASMRSPEMEADARWHLDKRVPISLLMMMLAQTVGAFWWAATIQGRVDNLEKDAVRSAPQADRLTRLEVNVEVLKDGVIEIKRILTQKK